MNVLAMIRRIIWGIILSICLTVTLLYLVVSNTFLTGNGLHQVVSSSSAAQTVRDTILLPKILDTIHASKYADFLDDQTVKKAFNETVSVDNLNNKLTPAITSLQAWLNSKEPSITFSIDTSDISTQFIDRLSVAAGDKFIQLPRCTSKNTLAEAMDGTCKSPLMDEATFVTAINIALKGEAALQSTSLNQDSAPLFSYLEYTAHYFPDYLNIFYGLSIITGGVAILIIVWLLLKHRLIGIVTIGLAGIATGLFLLGAAIALPLVTPNYASQPLANELALSAVHLLGDNIRTMAFSVACGSLIITILTLVILMIMSRRHKNKQKMHLDSSRTHTEN